MRKNPKSEEEPIAWDDQARLIWKKSPPVAFKRFWRYFGATKPSPAELS
jgi:hypothetical protein